MRTILKIIIVILGITVMGQVMLSCQSRKQLSVSTQQLLDSIEALSARQLAEEYYTNDSVLSEKWFNDYDSLASYIARFLVVEDLTLSERAELISQVSSFRAIWEDGWDGLCGEVYYDCPSQIDFAEGYWYARYIQEAKFYPKASSWNNGVRQGLAKNDYDSKWYYKLFW